MQVSFCWIWHYMINLSKTCIYKNCSLQINKINLNHFFTFFPFLNPFLVHFRCNASIDHILKNKDKIFFFMPSRSRKSLKIAFQNRSESSFGIYIQVSQEINSTPTTRRTLVTSSRWSSTRKVEIKI